MNNICDEGACAIAKALERNQILETLGILILLVLFSNNITNIGAISLSNTIRFNGALKTIRQFLTKI